MAYTMSYKDVSPHSWDEDTHIRQLSLIKRCANSIEFWQNIGRGDIKHMLFGETNEFLNPCFPKE